MKGLGLVACIALLSFAALAQNGPTCSVTIINSNSSNCTGNEWLPNLTACEYAKVSCPTFNGVTIADNYITFGYKNPTGTSKGTVLFFSDGGGETTDEDAGGTSTAYAEYYNAQNYQVVQTAWSSDWEDTGTSTKQIAYAAGRPAAFILWAYNNLFGSITQTGTAGMCVQGASAGGAAAMYALAWYGQYSIIDKVSLLSAPPLSDVARGCYYLTNGLSRAPTAVCPSGQLGCNSYNSPASWTQAVNYTSTALGQVQTWTGDNNCGGPYETTGAELSAWKKMSIVDGNVATFNYPQTAITTWLCSSVANGGTMNNSSPEAQLFFQQFTSPSQYYSLVINGVGSCASSEEVGPGTPPQNYVNMGYTTGMEAIEYDMVTDPVNQCKS